MDVDQMVEEIEHVKHADELIIRDVVYSEPQPNGSRSGPHDGAQGRQWRTRD